MKSKRKRPKGELSKFEREYASTRPVAERFLTEVGHQLDRLLGQANISLAFPLQARVKDWQSVADKLHRTAVPLDRLRELQDIIGFRMVLQFRRDVQRVCDMISSNFTVTDRYDTAERLREDQFGYASVHFVVQLPPGWLSVPSMSEFGDLRAEIQVRTTAQHIWAAASHTLQYKTEASVPPTVRRAISRVSALLETVDLELERVLLDREAYRAGAATAETGREQLNVDLLEQLLDEKWPPENKVPGRENYAELLADLKEFDVITGDELAKLIAKHRASVLHDDTDQVNTARSAIEEGLDEDFDHDRLQRGVYFTHAGLTRGVMQRQFGTRWQSYATQKFAPRLRERLTSR